MSEAIKEFIRRLVSGALFWDKGYSAAKSANVRLVWLRTALADYSVNVLPPHVQIVSPYKCNYQCTFCGGHGIDDDQHKRLNSQTCIAPKRLERILRKTLPTAYTWATAASGEFFIQPDIVGLLKLARPFKSNLSVTTNGSVLSPAIISEFIPNARSLRFSMVSSVRPAYEFFHRHGDFVRVVNNIRTLTRANELLGPAVKNTVDVGMYGPILVSTMHELSYRVRAAHALGMDRIGSTSFLLQTELLAAKDPRWLNERGELYPGLWNACRAAAGTVANSLGIIDSLHRPFDGADPEPDIELPEADLMFPNIRAAISDEPPIESLFAEKQIEADAAEIAENVRKTSGRTEVTAAEESAAAEKVELLRDFVSRHADTLAAMLLDDETTIRICWRFNLNANILPDNFARPCCLSPIRFPIDPNDDIEDIYNSAEMKEFAHALAYGEPPKGCADCRDLLVVSRSEVIRSALSLEEISDSKLLYNNATKFAKG